MYKRPVVLGVFSNPSPQLVTLSELFAQFGNNTGNMLFSESLVRNLGGAGRGTLSYEKGSRDDDCIVLAAANWLNSAVDFGSVAEQIERSGLPTIAVGLGAQSELKKSVPVLKAGTLRLLKVISERSAELSVRGDFSAEVLAKYGITNVRVTGCPSLLLAGDAAPNSPSFEPLNVNNVAYGSTRHGFHLSENFQTYMYREAFRTGSDIVLQSELADMYFATKRLNNEEITRRATLLCSNVYGNTDMAVSAYLQAHGKVFFNLDSWISYMRSKSFYIGTRLHGVVASLLGATPALLVCHDSRTLEVAQTMKLPYVLQTEIDTAKPLDLARLHDLSQGKQFSDNYPQYRANFIDFFSKNQLQFKSFAGTSVTES